MELHNLKPAKGAVKNAKRIGRGEGSKKGGTSTRGHKGAKSRSGYSKKIKNKVVKDDLVKNGLVQKRDLVKVLARGELKSKLEITANAFSKTAIEIIEKLGGKAIIIDKK